MLKGQAAALLTASTDEENEKLEVLPIKYEGRPNLEDGQKCITSGRLSAIRVNVRAGHRPDLRYT